MKELDEMEKINAKLSAAVEEVTLEHCKKTEVILTRRTFSRSFVFYHWIFIHFAIFVVLADY